LAGDLGCSSLADEACRAPRGCRVAALAERLTGSDEERREQTLRDLAMLVGAAMLARASDPLTARALLTTCRGRSPAGEE
jgi:hypothetical protein